MVFYTKNLLNLGISTILFSSLMMRIEMLPTHFNSVSLDKLQLTEAEVTMQWVDLVQSCSLVIAVIALKLAPPTPLPQYYPQMMTLSSINNWSSWRTCVNFVSLIKHRKGSKITSFVFWRNGQRAPTKKRKLTTDVSIWWDTNLWCFWCW